MISRFLKEAGMEVVGTARDGVDGLEKIAALKPDVITLDVEMPRMDGLDMLRRLMEEDPRPVVMVSSVTQAQTPAAVEALMLGAVEIVAKPGGAISLNLDEVRAEIVAKVRTAAGVRVAPPRRTVTSPARRRQRPPSSEETTPVRRTRRTALLERRFETVGEDKPRRRPALITSPAPVVIGSSTGGPSALSTVLASIGSDFPRPIVVVQHMPPGFTASLARRLDSLSELRVEEAREGIVPRPGEAWVAPGGKHVVFDRRGRFMYSEAPPHLGVKPAVDLTLESAVETWGGDVIAVILTGMGVDGTRGARTLKRVGGRVIAQDEQSSVVYGMPRAVAELGLTDVVCSLDEISRTLTRLAADTVPQVR